MAGDTGLVSLDLGGDILLFSFPVQLLSDQAKGHKPSRQGCFCCCRCWWHAAEGDMSTLSCRHAKETASVVTPGLGSPAVCMALSSSHKLLLMAGREGRAAICSSGALLRVHASGRLLGSRGCDVQAVAQAYGVVSRPLTGAACRCRCAAPPLTMAGAARQGLCWV